MPIKRPAWKSPVAWLTGMSGGTGVLNAVWTDPTFVDLLKRATTWFGISFAALAALIAYMHWRNNTPPRSW